MSPELEAEVRKLRHDLKNPLAAILAEAQLLLLGGPTVDEQTAESIREIEKQARRMRDLLRG